MLEFIIQLHQLLVVRVDVCIESAIGVYIDRVYYGT